MPNKIYTNKTNGNLECDHCDIPIETDGKFINSDWGGYLCLSCAKDIVEDDMRSLQEDILVLEKDMSYSYVLLQNIKKEMEV